MTGTLHVLFWRLVNLSVVELFCMLFSHNTWLSTKYSMASYLSVDSLIF